MTGDVSELTNSELHRWYWIASSMPIAAAAYYALRLTLYYHKLPVDIPVHFDFRGNPNQWMRRWAWLVVSPMFLAWLVTLVFTTRPLAPERYLSPSGMAFWSVYGLVTGAFLAILRAALSQERLQFTPLVLGAFLMTIGETILVLVCKRWWMV